MQRMNPKLAGISSIFLIAVLAYCLSIIFWKYYSPNISLQQILVNPFLTISKESNDLQNFFINYSLFGVSPVVNAPVKKSQPKRVRPVTSKISLEVKGIMFGSILFAIIETDGVQEIYTIGEYISHLYISDIAVDYVEFDDDGYKQKVYIIDGVTLVGLGLGKPGEAFNNSQAQIGQVQVPRINEAQIGGKNLIAPVLNSVQQAKLLQIKNSIRTNPLQVIGTMNVIPFRVGGKITGFQVTPGSERELFKASGLLSGDIILSVNGQSLSEVNDFTKGMQFMNKLSNAKDFDFIISRRGEQKRVFLNLQN